MASFKDGDIKCINRSLIEHQHQSQSEAKPFTFRLRARPAERIWCSNGSQFQWKYEQ